MNKFLTNNEDITAWLDKYKIKKYTLIPDNKYGYVVEVNGGLDLSNRTLDFIPVKFNKITGSFYCYNNQLTSLEFCPQQIGVHFDCALNKITSLEFCPETVGGYFDCSYNQLISLEFCPRTIEGYFACTNNRLASLEFCPELVGEYFYCDNNPELGDLKKIEDFSIIYQEQLSFKEKKDLFDTLEQELDNNIKTNKLKQIKVKI